jgi:osmoprotectant transport system permease protein
MSLLGVSLEELLRLAQAHLVLSGCAMLLAILVGLPVAIWAAGDGRRSGPVVALVSLFQTIPGLALLALFYPLLLFLGRATGLAIPALGFLPALLALGIYAVFPILRNALAALRGIDPVLTEAANGLGMTRGQRLLRVDLPLGAPVILAGIRTASVWTIGTATLATTIGQPSLGDLIFSGLQTEDWQRVLAGCLGSAALALLVDGLIALMEDGLRRHKPGRRIAGLIALAVLAAVSVLPLRPAAGAGEGRLLVIGAKNFSEQYILARLIESRLQAAGYRTQRRDNLGSAIAYRALAAGDIDVYVDYSGTLWSNVLGRTDTPPSEVMLPVLTRALAARDGVDLLGPLGFENAYAFAMTASRAKALGIANLRDLAGAAPRLKLGADLEFLNRPEWAAVRDGYGLRFDGARGYSPTFMYRALTSGEADVISAFSSDGRIAALDLMTLADPDHVLPRYDAVLLLAPGVARQPRIVAALEPLVGSISIDAMREANWMVDRDADKATPRQAADWLAGQLKARVP